MVCVATTPDTVVTRRLAPGFPPVVVELVTLDAIELVAPVEAIEPFDLCLCDGDDALLDDAGDARVDDADKLDGTELGVDVTYDVGDCDR